MRRKALIALVVTGYIIAMFFLVDGIAQSVVGLLKQNLDIIDWPTNRGPYLFSQQDWPLWVNGLINIGLGLCLLYITEGWRRYLKKRNASTN